MRSSIWFFSGVVGCAGSGLGEMRQDVYQAAAHEVFRADLVDLAGGEHAWVTHEVQVPADAPVFTVTSLGGAGDADLYLRRNGAPTTATFDCRSWADGNTERCEILDPEPGTWTIGLYGYTAFEGVRLDWDVVLSTPRPDSGTEAMEIARIPTTNRNQPCISVAGMTTRHGVLEVAHTVSAEVRISSLGTQLCEGWRSCAAPFPDEEQPIQACVTEPDEAGELVLTWTPVAMLHDLELPAGFEDTTREVEVPEGAVALFADLSEQISGGRVEIRRGDVVYCAQSARVDCALESPVAGVYEIRAWHESGARLRVSLVE
jgi:hypothetical protein